jgi:N-methylhydantoinase B/oxoprolinase/acetone carboxylase alpha subunit
LDIKTGDVLVKISSGGGGVGEPIERPAELVALDVKNEMISIDVARKIYGVVVDPVTFAVDEAETRRLRALPQSSWDVIIDEDALSVELAPHETV